MLLAAEMLVGGMWGILRIPYAREMMAHLGYPGYFTELLGVWYVLGGVALLTQRFPRLKEWAYAGATFVYTGAIVSHLAVHDHLRMAGGAAVVPVPHLRVLGPAPYVASPCALILT